PAAREPPTLDRQATVRASRERNERFEPNVATLRSEPRTRERESQRRIASGSHAGTRPKRGADNDEKRWLTTIAAVLPPWHAKMRGASKPARRGPPIRARMLASTAAERLATRNERATTRARVRRLAGAIWGAARSRDPGRRDRSAGSWALLLGRLAEEIREARVVPDRIEVLILLHVLRVGEARVDRRRERIESLV